MNILYCIPLTVRFCSVSFLKANPTHESYLSHRAGKSTDHTLFNHFPIGHDFLCLTEATGCLQTVQEKKVTVESILNLANKKNNVPYSFCHMNISNPR